KGTSGRGEHPRRGRAGTPPKPPASREESGPGGVVSCRIGLLALCQSGRGPVRAWPAAIKPQAVRGGVCARPAPSGASNQKCAAQRRRLGVRNHPKIKALSFPLPLEILTLPPSGRILKWPTRADCKSAG